MCRHGFFTAFHMLSRAALLALSLLAAPSRASLVSISVAVPEQGALLAGQSLRITYSGVLTAGDAANLTRARLVPFLDGAQYGAEVGFTGLDGSGQPRGEAYIPLPWWSAAANHTLALAFVGDPVDGFTMGTPVPAGAIVSDSVPLSAAPRAPRRPHAPAAGETLLTLYFEAWFTPVNFDWQSWYGGPHGAGLAEAIPTIGRYATFDTQCLRTQAAQFVQAGVDALVVDWTNNCWLPACSSWANRSADTQEIVNATNVALATYNALRVTEGWDVPKFVILLALDNGGTTPMPALLDELDYIATHYLANETAGGPDSFVFLDGKPLVLIFDALGQDHSGFDGGKFTIRWMASQLQNAPDLARRGFWSWMDASAAPVLTLDASNASVVEAAVLEPAYFASGGWLDGAVAVGRSGGLTLLGELSALFGATVGNGSALPRFVNVCQWNEYAGTPQGQAATYEDSYSPDLSNDLEPTSPWAPAYQRPGNVRAGGGWGYLGLNALALARAALVDPAAVDGSAAVFIVSPAVGALANYSLGESEGEGAGGGGGGGGVSLMTEVSFVVASFSLVRMRAGGPFLANVSVPVVIEVDGAVVASLPAPAAPGLQTFTLDVGALDARFPHVLTITAQGAGSLTRWPLGFDTVDADAPGGVPLAAPVAARGTAWLWLPQSQAAEPQLEAPALEPPWGEVALLRSSVDIGSAVGYCNGQAFVFRINSGANSGLGFFALKLVPALNGAPRPAVSLLGLGYSSVRPGPEGAVGDASGTYLAANPWWSPQNTTGNQTPVLFLAAPDPNDATWLISAGLADPTNFSLASASRHVGTTGLFLTRAASDGATLCANGDGRFGEVAGLSKGEGADAAAATFVLGPPPAPAPQPPGAVAVDAASITHRLNPFLRGCHSDPGYEFQPRMLHAQLLYGDSLQCGPELACAWQNTSVGANSAAGVAALDAAVSVNPSDPAPSLSLTFSSGTGAVAWSNRGIGNEGLYLEAGKAYEGRVVVLAPAGAAALYVALNDYVSGTVLASARVAVPASPEWQVVDFSLAPVAGCACEGIPWTSNASLDCGPQGTNPGHVCVRCSGEFAVGLAAPAAGAVHVGYAYLAPGPWGRFKGQPVLATGAALLQQLGWRAVRWGGHIARITAWKAWRGAQWLRASMQLDDARRFISAGFGVFEFVDLARDADVDIFPILSLSKDQSAEDWADLVEYCWGDASTPWGATRIFNDSHPAVFNISAVELGNEEGNPNFVAQVVAMEARRRALGVQPWVYIYPASGGVDNTTAAALVAAGVSPRAIAADCHIDGTGGCLDVLRRDFAALPGFDQSGANLEINALVSIAGRLSLEALDLQQWLAYGAAPGEDPTRLVARTTSFCAMRSGHVEPPWADQGVAFFLPNATTFVQPAGYVHVMLAAAWQPNALRISGPGTAAPYSASAQLSDDGLAITLQAVNTGASAGSIAFSVSGFAAAGDAANVTIINATDYWAGNTPAYPTRISPLSKVVSWGGGNLSIDLPPNSYAVITAHR